MSGRKEVMNAGGINGIGEGLVNTNSSDYKSLQEAIKSHALQQTKEEKTTFGLLSLKYQMETYLSNEKAEKLITVGDFLKSCLTAIGVKNKTFAKYIDCQESNLSAIISGRRKINVDLAFKLGQIFNMAPSLWLLVQSKNELFKVKKGALKAYKKYRLDDLLGNVA